MPFIILNDNAGELVINTDQIASITQTRLTPPLTYSLVMSSGAEPVNLDAKQYADLKSLVKAQSFPPSRATAINDRINPVK